MNVQRDLRLSGGQVFVEGRGLVAADLLINNGKIDGIVSRTSSVSAVETVDISGKIVLPGAIDPHVHLGKDIRIPRDHEDVDSETASAAVGGVTTMLVYLMSSDSYIDEMNVAESAMSVHSRVNYGYHFVLGTQQHLKEFETYMSLGVSSFKFFMNFRDDEGSYLGLPGNDDSFMFELLRKAASEGAMINPHPENIELVRMYRDQKSDGDLSPLAAWNEARPAFVEAEAAQRVAYLASVTGASVYSVHTSSSEAEQALDRVRAYYSNIFVETCPQYLALDTDSDAGTYAKVNPPVRTKADVEHMWDALANNRIDSIGSDHNSRHKSAKEKNIWDATAGFPGTGTLLPLTLSEGLRRGVPLEKLVDVTSTRSAKLFGMYPQKGVIAVGSDADLVVIDLASPSVVEATALQSSADYTPWEGTEISLSVTDTIVRGEFALRDGKLTESINGTYVHRPNSGRASLEGIK